jgi:hypothetical protein
MSDVGLTLRSVLIAIRCTHSLLILAQENLPKKLPCMMNQWPEKREKREY